MYSCNVTLIILRSDNKIARVLREMQRKKRFYTSSNRIISLITLRIIYHTVISLSIDVFDRFYLFIIGTQNEIISVITLAHFYDTTFAGYYHNWRLFMICSLWVERLLCSLHADEFTLRCSHSAITLWRNKRVRTVTSNFLNGKERTANRKGW